MWEQHVYLCDQNKSSESGASGVWDKLQWTWPGSPSTPSTSHWAERENYTCGFGESDGSSYTVCKISNIYALTKTDARIGMKNLDALNYCRQVACKTDWEKVQQCIFMCYTPSLKLFDVAATVRINLKSVFAPATVHACMGVYEFILVYVCAHWLQRHCSTSLTEGLLLIKQLCERGLLACMCVCA